MTPPPRQFAMLLFDGFSNVCLANAVEPLRGANMLARQRLYSWRFLGPTAAPVHSSSGLPVQPDPLLPSSCGDFLCVMPSYGHRDLATPTQCRQLRGAAARFGTLIGLDTGPWLLARAGLLDGCRATAHWDILEDLAETFPAIDIRTDRFVIDGARITGGGATTTLELMLELIERHHGTTLALEVAALFMFGERDPRTDPVAHLPDTRIVQAAAALMRRNVEMPLPIAVIARRVGLRQRALEEVFRRHAGRSPVRVYRSIRLHEARRRLEQTRASVAEIALRSGYRDATAMARAVRAEFGLSPSAIRRAAREREGRDGAGADRR